MYTLSLSRPIDARALREAVAVAFAAEPREVQVDADLSPPTQEGIWLRCTWLRRGGEFPLSVSVYPQGQPGRTLPPELVVAERIGERLRVGILVSDDTLNPFRWILVDAAGTRPVFVEVEALERDELVLDRTHIPR